MRHTPPQRRRTARCGCAPRTSGAVRRPTRSCSRRAPALVPCTRAPTLSRARASLWFVEERRNRVCERSWLRALRAAAASSEAAGEVLIGEDDACFCTDFRARLARARAATIAHPGVFLHALGCAASAYSRHEAMRFEPPPGGWGVARFFAIWPSENAAPVIITGDQKQRASES